MQKGFVSALWRALRPYAVLAAVTLCVALLLCSNLFTRPQPGKHPEAALSPEAPVSLVAANEERVVNYLPDKLPAKTLTLEFASDSMLPVYLTGTVELQDTAFAPGLRYAAGFAATPSGTHRTVTVPLDSADGATQIRVTLHAASDAYVLVGATLNKPEPMRLAWGKWLLLFAGASLIYTIFHRKWYALVYDFKNKRHALLLAGTMVLCLAFGAYVGVTNRGEAGFARPYAPDSFDSLSHAHYERQFDAWQHGQLALRAQPDAALLALDNPYSIEARNASGAPYLYDTVLFEGQYYSYYGIAPLLCVYYPFYWLTGALPTGITVCTLLALFGIVGIYGALQELLLAFRLRPNLLLYLLCAPAVVCGAMLYYNQSCLLVYYVPLLSALAFLAWFVCMAFRAARTDAPWLRAVRFVLTAVCLALCVASRPNVAVFCVAFAAPLFLGVLLDGSRPRKLRFGDAAAFAVPAFLLCMGVLWYNYARFGSFADFGSAYNLTNNDIRFNTLTFTPARFFDMLYNSFLRPFETQSTFPFVTLGAGSVADTGRFFYSAAQSMGVFAMPLAWFAALAPNTLRRREAVKSATYLCVWAAALFIGYVNFCVGGVMERYTCDLLLPLLLVAAPVLLELFRTEGRMRPGGWLYTAACAVCCATIFFGAITVFAPHPDIEAVMTDYAPDAYLAAQRFFTPGA